MTYRFGKSSLSHLNGVHPKAIAVVKKALSYQVMDFGIAEGVRSYDTQQTYFNTGRSKTMNSKHLLQEDGFGHAVDLYPYPINMREVDRFNAQEIIRFGVLNGLMQVAALEVGGVMVTWGADWNNDGRTMDHDFFDAMHWQFKILD